MSSFTHHLRRALVIKLSGSRKSHFVARSILYRCGEFGNATIVCSVCFTEKKNEFEKEEMGQAGEGWEKSGEK